MPTEIPQLTLRRQIIKALNPHIRAVQAWVNDWPSFDPRELATGPLPKHHPGIQVKRLDPHTLTSSAVRPDNIQGTLSDQPPLHTRPELPPTNPNKLLKYAALYGLPSLAAGALPFIVQNISLSLGFQILEMGLYDFTNPAVFLFLAGVPNALLAAAIIGLGHLIAHKITHPKTADFEIVEEAAIEPAAAKPDSSKQHYRSDPSQGSPPESAPAPAPAPQILKKTILRPGVTVASRHTGQTYLITDQQLGAGGQASVFVCTDQRGREYAIKFIPYQLEEKIKESQEDMGAANSSARLELEAAVLEKVKGHPYIVRFVDSDFYHNQPFLIMELLQGQTLDKKLKANREQQVTMTLAEAINTIFQIIDGLAAVAKQNYVNRDVKPGNVMLLDNGVAKTFDYGMAAAVVRHLRRHLTLEGLMVGTYAYMDPYVLNEEPKDAADSTTKTIGIRRDIYAAGVMLYEMLTNVRPTVPHGANERQSTNFMIEYVRNARNGQHWSPPEHDKISPALYRILNKMLTSNLAQRYASYEDLISDLTDCLPEASDVVEMTSVLSHASSRRRAREASIVMARARLDNLPLPPQDLGEDKTIVDVKRRP